MTPQKNAEVLELPTSTLWFEENGILCVNSKRSPPQTTEEQKQSLKTFFDFLNGRKVCLLLDVTLANPSSEEQRELASAEFPGFTRALAFLSGSALGKMVANIFFSIKKQPYPLKMFTDEAEAKEWLKQYL